MVQTFVHSTKCNNLLVENPTAFHFLFFFLIWSGVSELEKDLVNISVAIETLGSNTTDAIVTFQKKISQLSEISLKIEYQQTLS